MSIYEKMVVLYLQLDPISTLFIENLLDALVYLIVG